MAGYTTLELLSLLVARGLSDPMENNASLFLASEASPASTSAASASLASAPSLIEPWPLYSLLLCVPLVTVFGNFLVILAIFKEPKLNSHHTNHFIASLAACDLLVGLLVMPAAVYQKVMNDSWLLGGFFCHFFLFCDVAGSTASILHLVLISIDRYIAIIYPTTYKYRLKKQNTWCLIALVWLISIGLAVPVMLGWADGEAFERNDCALKNPHYLLYSSLLSFYIPALILLAAYARIFWKINYVAGLRGSQRVRQQSETISSGGQSVPTQCHPDIRVQEPTVVVRDKLLQPLNDDDEFDDVIDDVIDDDVASLRHRSESLAKRSMSFPQARLHTVKKATGGGSLGRSLTYPPTQITTTFAGRKTDQRSRLNQNNRLPKLNAIGPQRSESYDQIRAVEWSCSEEDSEETEETRIIVNQSAIDRLADIDAKLNGTGATKIPLSGSLSTYAIWVKPRGCSDSSTSTMDSPLPFRPTPPNSANSPGSFGERFRFRFRLNRKRTSSLQTRLKSITYLNRAGYRPNNIRKETRATNLVAIILGAFICCWLPFFSLNIFLAVCMLVYENCDNIVSGYHVQEAFFIATWLGYANSGLNPVLYTVFNQTYRKTFCRLLHLQKNRIPISSRGGNRHQLRFDSIRPTKTSRFWRPWLCLRRVLPSSHHRL